MEKIININFQGRVIPIEETAYNSLKQYIDSLRSHFANEESSDEIINDIENRIAELLSYRLKQGANCITATDLGGVINSIGRLEDIEAAESEDHLPPPGGTAPPPMPESAPGTRGRFYRNADDKVIAGVCSGIGNRMGIDPVIVRILFVLLPLFWLYILLWIIVPSQSISTNVTRRLYRNPDDKVIAGVCGGLAVYFRTSPRVVRAIFLLPLIIGILSRGMLLLWWHWPMWGIGPRIFMGSFGSTFFLVYVVLWIALPYARSATDMLEMRGEKIDMNSIKAATQAKAGAPAPRPSGSGLGRVIGILFKAFFLLIAGSIALGLFAALIGLLFSSFVAIPASSFLLDGWGQSVIAWCGIVLFLGIPFLALITWMVRRLTGARSHRHYLGYVFVGLWLIGLISIIILAGTLMSDFSNRSAVEEAYAMAQPTNNKLYINVSDEDRPDTHHDRFRWYGNYGNTWGPFRIIRGDSFWLNTVKVGVAQSKDSLFHIYETRISRGETQEHAKELASHIPFAITQHDSIITLPGGFMVSNKDKFRNQQVMITVEVPVGKQIELSDDIEDYDWFSINMDSRSYYYEHQWNRHFRPHWRHGDGDMSSGQFQMTSSGLKKTKDTSKEWDEDDDNDNDD